MINVVVLAGSSSPGKLEKYAEEDNKALIVIKGKPMLIHVLEALGGVSRVGEIKLVGSPPQLIPVLQEYQQPSWECISQGNTLLENLEAGLRAVPLEYPCLIVTSDIPLIGSEAVEDFLARCGTMQKDFYYPIIEEQECRRKFPETERTYVKLREGRFTGGNMTLLQPSSILEKINDLYAVFSYRKQPWKYIRMLSVPLAVKFLLKRATIPELEFQLSRYFSLEIEAVRTPYPEIGTDVDKPEDLNMIRSWL